MSYDFATERVCSHRIGPQRSLLNADNQTYIVFDRTPVNSSVSVQIDGVEIPRSGLYSNASIVFSKREPFRIVSGKSDLLYVKVGHDAARTIQLPAGSSVRASDIARTLSNSIPELVFSVLNGHVVASTSGAVKGPSFSFPDPRWTDRTESLISTSRVLGAMKVLGIVPGRVGSGRKLFPGWTVTLNQYAFVEEFIVLFEDPIPNFAPVVTVTYQTVAQLCGRCQGSRIEYDYTVQGQSYEKVRDTDLLAQELDKYIFTKIGSHWKWRWLGSALVDRIGGKANTAFGTAAGFVSMDIGQAFSNYQNIKRQQERSAPQQAVSDAEFPYSLDGLRAVSDPNDPTSVSVQITIRNRSSIAVPLTREISLPDPFQLTSDPTGTLRNANSGFILRG